MTKQASFERKTRNFYARTRDAAINYLVMFDIFKDENRTPRDELFPQIHYYHENSISR